MACACVAMSIVRGFHAAHATGGGMFFACHHRWQGVAVAVPALALSLIWRRCPGVAKGVMSA